ncbi:MAG: DUF2935 domain-containing protein [Lachnospiraceae bacterium]
MTTNYVTLSLETHLFFARIMKEHSLFLTAGFTCKDTCWTEKSEFFRQQFEELLSEVINISNFRINEAILSSGELVTEFTIPAEKRTEHFSGLPINSELTRQESELQAGASMQTNRSFLRQIHRLNERSLSLLNGLITFKESILKHVSECHLFTFNYPLLIKHIIREACLYRNTIDNLMHGRQMSYQGLWGTEEFWNRIMMEHALFIRGLLDPSEEDLIKTANDFALDYKKLLEMAKKQDCLATDALTEKSLEETIKYQQFKTAGTKGILNCDITSIILPLLADHVLREANHYLRILECAEHETEPR